jgi:hypothetical protein
MVLFCVSRVLSPWQHTLVGLCRQLLLTPRTLVCTKHVQAMLHSWSCTVCRGHPNRHGVQLQMTSHALSASATEQVVHACQTVQHRQGASPFLKA